METHIIYPRDPALSDVIQYFLFIRNDDPEYDQDHVSFPNTNHCLGIHQRNRLADLSATEYRIERSTANHSFLTGIYRRPITIRSIGIFNQVCINFEPGGLERLTGRPLSNQVFVADVIQTHLPRKWEGMYDAAFSNTSPADRARSLEQFLMGVAADAQAGPRLSLNHLSVDRVEQLSDAMNMSYRSVNRWFHRALGLPPKEFLNIVRFRRAVSQLFRSKSQLNAAIDSGYCDQSHMIRMFQRYSGMPPGDFLRRSAMINNELCWSIQ